MVGVGENFKINIKKYPNLDSRYIFITLGLT